MEPGVGEVAEKKEESDREVAGKKEASEKKQQTVHSAEDRAIQLQQRAQQLCPRQTSAWCATAWSAFELWDVIDLAEHGGVKKSCAWVCECKDCFACATDTKKRVGLTMHFASNSTLTELKEVQQQYLEVYQATLRDAKTSQFL